MVVIIVYCSTSCSLDICDVLRMKCPKFTVVTLTLNFQTNHCPKQVSTSQNNNAFFVTSATEDTFIVYQHNRSTLTRDTNANLK